jgi:hypothetical protein
MCSYAMISKFKQMRKPASVDLATSATLCGALLQGCIYIENSGEGKFIDSRVAEDA